jgi:hypothetical protein
METFKDSPTQVLLNRSQEIALILEAVQNDIHEIRKTLAGNKPVSGKKYTTSEAASYVFLSKSRFYHISKNITSTKPSGKIKLYSQEALDEYLNLNPGESDLNIERMALNHASKTRKDGGP